MSPTPDLSDRTRQAFYRLVTDWIHLHEVLPRPSSGEVVRRSGSRTYGHPSEWASDRAAEIAHILWSWHDNVAEKRGERPPPPLSSSERTRVVTAWRYLEPRFDYLVGMVDGEALDEATRIHGTIQRVLGRTCPKIILPFPCPAPGCGLRTLERDVRVGVSGSISCGACGYSAREENYRFMLRVILDTLIDSE